MARLLFFTASSLFAAVIIVVTTTTTSSSAHPLSKSLLFSPPSTPNYCCGLDQNPPNCPVCDNSTSGCCGYGTMEPTCMVTDQQCCSWYQASAVCPKTSTCCGADGVGASSYAFCCLEKGGCCQTIDDGSSTCFNPKDAMCCQGYNSYTCPLNSQCASEGQQCCSQDQIVCDDTLCCDLKTQQCVSGKCQWKTTMAPYATLAPGQTRAPFFPIFHISSECSGRIIIPIQGASEGDLLCYGWNETTKRISGISGAVLFETAVGASEQAGVVAAQLSDRLFFLNGFVIDLETGAGAYKVPIFFLLNTNCHGNGQNNGAVSVHRMGDRYAQVQCYYGGLYVGFFDTTNGATTGGGVHSVINHIGDIADTPMKTAFLVDSADQISALAVNGGHNKTLWQWPKESKTPWRIRNSWFRGLEGGHSTASAAEVQVLQGGEQREAGTRFVAPMTGAVLWTIARNSSTVENQLDGANPMAFQLLPKARYLALGGHEHPRRLARQLFPQRRQAASQAVFAVSYRAATPLNDTRRQFVLHDQKTGDVAFRSSKYFGGILLFNGWYPLFPVLALGRMYVAFAAASETSSSIGFFSISLSQMKTECEIPSGVIHRASIDPMPLFSDPANAPFLFVQNGAELKVFNGCKMMHTFPLLPDFRITGVTVASDVRSFIVMYKNSQATRYQLA